MTDTQAQKKKKKKKKGKKQDEQRKSLIVINANTHPTTSITKASKDYIEELKNELRETILVCNDSMPDQVCVINMAPWMHTIAPHVYDHFSFSLQKSENGSRRKDQSMPKYNKSHSGVISEPRI